MTFGTVCYSMQINGVQRKCFQLELRTFSNTMICSSRIMISRGAGRQSRVSDGQPDNVVGLQVATGQ